MAKRQLTAKSEDMSKWYTEVIRQAKLADYSPVKGCMVFRPNGYGIWENIQKSYQTYLDKMEIKNCYFPIFIPMSFLRKEAKHVEGFAPELAVVTHAGGEKLQEELAIRPTSETIMYDMYSKWVQSHRDLPILLNQWNNVVRWEKRTNFFLRTTEFLWQEAHTAHTTKGAAVDLMYEALESYRSVVEDYMAVPVVTGRKSESEKFAGADITTTIEAMMPDGKALQSGTSHHLGQNFSKENAFNISFQDKENKTQYVWQNSFGLSTRIIGAIIMTHGDDEGLVIPPKIAPTQVMVVVASKDEAIINHAVELTKQLKKAGIRADKRVETTTSMGWKMNDCELEGIPICLIIGQREIDNNEVTMKTRYNSEKSSIKKEGLNETINKTLDKIQSAMFKKAQENVTKLTTEANTYAELKNTMKGARGYIKAFWCESQACEKAIKEETKATTRCLPFTDKKGTVKEEHGKCIKCGGDATHRWLFAQAY